MKETSMNSEEVNASNEGWKTVDQNNEVVQNVQKESMNDKLLPAKLAGNITYLYIYVKYKYCICKHYRKF